MDKVALEQVFIPVLRFPPVSIIQPTLHTNFPPVSVIPPTLHTNFPPVSIIQPTLHTNFPPVSIIPPTLYTNFPPVSIIPPTLHNSFHQYCHQRTSGRILTNFQSRYTPLKIRESLEGKGFLWGFWGLKTSTNLHPKVNKHYGTGSYPG